MQLSTYLQVDHVLPAVSPDVHGEVGVFYPVVHQFLLVKVYFSLLTPQGTLVHCIVNFVNALVKVWVGPLPKHYCQAHTWAKALVFGTLEILT